LDFGVESDVPIQIPFLGNLPKIVQNFLLAGILSGPVWVLLEGVRVEERPYTGCLLVSSPDISPQEYALAATARIPAKDAH
jgi:hypothetical protein